MDTLLPGRVRAGLASAVAISALSVSASALAGARTETVRFEGGDAYDEVQCRNLAPDAHVQQNRCKATARGGHVALQDVDIHFAGRAVAHVNGGAVDFVSVGGGDATAGAMCVNDSGGVSSAKSVNACHARARGGSVVMRDVQVIVHRQNGTTTTRRGNVVAVGNRPAHANVGCSGLSASTPRCDARAGGGSVEMRGVDLVEPGRTRRGVDVSVTGGDATAIVHCRNSAGSAKVQINVCSATAEGGDAVMRNVRLHAYE